MKTITVILFCFLAVTSWSQVETIDATIADYDAEIAMAIEEEMPEIVPHISTTCPLILPAIGLVNHQIDIYFDKNREEAENDDSEILTSTSIRKVKFQIASGSYQLDYAFYFDLLGHLIYQSERAEDASYGCTLSSYYFDKGKCVQFRSELLATEFCEVPSENQPEIRTELSDSDLLSIKWIIDSSNKFKQLLALYAELLLN